MDYEEEMKKRMHQKGYSDADIEKGYKVLHYLAGAAATGIACSASGLVSLFKRDLGPTKSTYQWCREHLFPDSDEVAERSKAKHKN